MKVVINKCYGGFSLSPQATKRLAELQGKKCFFYLNDFSKDRYKKVEMGDIEKHSLFWMAFATDDVEFLNKTFERADWHKMTTKQKDEYNKLYEEMHLTSSPKDRTDNLLIQVVEELGKEANGGCAELKIIEIPDGVDYTIEEYDGLEHIAEAHKTWG